MRFHMFKSKFFILLPLIVHESFDSKCHFHMFKSKFFILLTLIAHEFFALNDVSAVSSQKLSSIPP